MIRPIIAANWKMNKTVSESLDFVSRLMQLVIGMNDRQVVIAPPFTALYAVGAALKGSSIGLAAQNLSENKDGAYTGEVSARMLADAGCTHVIIGHSERRTIFGESNDVIRAKISMALQSGMQPIVCIGETIEERESGRTFDVIAKQIKEGLNQIETSDIKHIIIAYEPVWAIGAGKTATPEQAGEVHGFIRKLMEERYGEEPARRLPVLYGGSVNPDNIGKLMAQPDINGALVGGAGLNVDTFGKIISF
ncbi:MAG: triose-phosphate isomerase [Syntrophales bacterium]|nr:triose-phosphate isomerase [Syntrophales bacterium]PKN60642.1 MAG: triose-phosphate isomerase [Deltaproteobacteria bacterium HGW-Deltaproteobacteria-11]